MRYRLRTLLIVVTLLCVGIGGWLGYVRRMANFHRRKADRIVSEISAIEPDPESVETAVNIIASGKAHVGNTRFGGSRGRAALLLETGGKPLFVVQTVVEDWEQAVDHKMMAERFDEAVTRPWVLLSSSHGNSKDTKRLFDLARETASQSQP